MGHSPPEHTFGHQNCRDLVEKLTRELGRLKTASNRDEIADHAINFAMTAWHLIDWLWNANEKNKNVTPDERYFVFSGAAAGARKSWENFADFRQYILDREPRLRDCGLIANEAKHLVLDEKRWPDQKNITTVVSAAASYSASAALGTRSKWVPKIVSDKGRVEAIGEFEGILAFWTRFIYRETSEHWFAGPTHSLTEASDCDSAKQSRPPFFCRIPLTERRSTTRRRFPRYYCPPAGTLGISGINLRVLGR